MIINGFCQLFRSNIFCCFFFRIDPAAMASARKYLRPLGLVQLTISISKRRCVFVVETMGTSTSVESRTSLRFALVLWAAYPVVVSDLRCVSTRDQCNMLYILNRGLVRAHEKPISGSRAIYFPGGIYTQFLHIRSLHLPLHAGKFSWDRQHMQAEAWVFSVYGKNRPG